MSIEPQEFVEKRPNRLFFKHIIRKIFFEDWMMKLVALAITLGLWLGVTGLSSPGSERYNNVPLSLRISDNSIVTNSPVQDVAIRVGGDKRKLEQINANDLRVSLDLTDVTPGDRVITLSPDTVSISLPNGIKIEEIQPNRIAVRLEAAAEKEVPVKVETNGEMPEGFELYGSTVTPEKILVRGPASFIRSLAYVSTDKIDVSERRADFTAKQVRVSVSNSFSTMLQTFVDVAFRIGEKRVEQSFSVPVKGEQGKRVNVVLFGGRSLFEGVKAEDIRVDMVKNDAGQEMPQVTLPPALDGKVEIRKPKT